MDGSTEQARALAETAGVRARPDLTLLRLDGDDQRTWLNGQVTNDVRSTRARDAVYALAVTVRGKIMADLWVLDDGERFTLAVPKDSVPALLESFESQIIMEDVEVERDEDAAVLSVQGPLAAEVLSEAGVSGFACDELGHGGRFVLTTTATADQILATLQTSARAKGGCAIDHGGYELARLRAGRPRMGADFGLENYPQEVGLKQRAVSFEKGCYLGQEVVCTLESRGKLVRQLARLRLPAQTDAKPGDEITDEGGARVGHITSLASDSAAGLTLALGQLKRAHATTGATLRCAGADVLFVSVVDG